MSRCVFQVAKSSVALLISPLTYSRLSTKAICWSVCSTSIPGRMNKDSRPCKWADIWDRQLSPEEQTSKSFLQQQKCHNIERKGFTHTHTHPPPQPLKCKQGKTHCIWRFTARHMPQSTMQIHWKNRGLKHKPFHNFTALLNSEQVLRHPEKSKSIGILTKNERESHKTAA